MILVEGELWEEVGKADLILITTNSMLFKSAEVRGHLVMGAGAALQAKERYPQLPYEFGRRIQAAKDPERYGIVTVPMSEGDWSFRIGAFQTKTVPFRPSPLDLIAYSLEKLRDRLHLFERVAINLPGCGLGGQPERVVLKMMAPMPDKVRVYKRP